MEITEFIRKSFSMAGGPLEKVMGLLPKLLTGATSSKLGLEEEGGLRNFHLLLDIPGYFNFYIEYVLLLQLKIYILNPCGLGRAKLFLKLGLQSMSLSKEEKSRIRKWLPQLQGSREEGRRRVSTGFSLHSPFWGQQKFCLKPSKSNPHFSLAREDHMVTLAARETGKMEARPMQGLDQEWILS